MPSLLSLSTSSSTLKDQEDWVSDYSYVSEDDCSDFSALEDCLTPFADQEDWVSKASVEDQKDCVSAPFFADQEDWVSKASVEDQK